MENRVKELLHEVVVGQAPGKLADIRTELSAWLARFADELENILVFKADRWLEIRAKEGVKSDKMADRLWDATVEGKQEIHLRSQIKYIERVISSIRTQLRVKESESFGNF